MSEEAAERAKDNGANAWKNGDFQQAVVHFSEAIDLSRDKDLLKLLHSNRSAAYMKLNRGADALTDGEKCVSLDCNWSKGYVRKGDALFALRRFTDAYNAYNAGLRVSAGDATLIEKAEQAMRAIRNESSSQPTQPSQSSQSNFPAVSLLSATQQRMVKMAVLALAVVYLLPFLGMLNGIAYRLSAGLFALLYVLELFAKHGMVKLNSEYAMRVFPDPAMMRVVLGTFLALSVRTYFFALVPALLVIVAGFTGEMMEYARNNSDQLEQTINPLLQRFAPQMSVPNIRSVLNPAMVPQISEALLRTAASCEVSQGIFFVFELLLPSRNIMQMFLWWQYLRMRYMMDKSGHVSAAFRDMDNKITQLLNYQFVPALVRTVYAKIKQYMSSQVQMPSASAAPQSSGLGSMFSKCTVM